MSSIQHRIFCIFVYWRKRDSYTINTKIDEQHCIPSYRFPLLNWSRYNASNPNILHLQKINWLKNHRVSDRPPIGSHDWGMIFDSHILAHTYSLVLLIISNIWTQCYCSESSKLLVDSTHIVIDFELFDQFLNLYQPCSQISNQASINRLNYIPKLHDGLDPYLNLKIPNFNTNWFDVTW